MNDANKAKKSDLIVEAALKLFAEKNFKEVSISEIAEEAGVAVGTVYEHFKNKEDLYFRIPAKRAEDFGSQLSLHLEGLHSPIEKIRKYVWFYLYYFKENPIITELILMELRVNKRYFNTRRQHQSLLKSTTAILELIKEGQESGDIRNDISPYTIRHMIIGALEHISTYWVLKDNQFDVVSFSKDVSTMLLSGIVTKKETNETNS